MCVGKVLPIHAPAVTLPLVWLTYLACADKSGMVGKWHLGTHEFLPTNHGFDYYYGAPMTQNECISNIRTPGSAKPPPGHSGDVIKQFLRI